MCCSLTERFNQTLVTHLMKLVNADGDDWDEHIDPILFGYRVNVQASTKVSPFEMLYGVKARLPVDLKDEDVADGPVTDEDIANRIEKIAQDLVTVREQGKTNLKEAQSKEKKRYDLKHAPPMFSVGDKVLKYDRRRETRMGDKLKPRYTGPYEVTEVLGRGVYRLKMGETVLRQTVNACNLKPWLQPDSPSQSPIATSVTKASPTSPNKTKDVASAAAVTASGPDCSTATPPQSGTSSARRTLFAVDDLTSTSPSVDASHATAVPWLPHFNLNTHDRDVLANGDWLNDKLVDAVNKLLATEMNGQEAQTSLLVQSSCGFKPINSGIRIVYAHNHWVAVACHDGNIFVANSLPETFSDVLIKQLKEMFVHHLDERGQLQVYSVRCAQQPNASDCGVYAAAFCFEWAAYSTLTDLSVAFNVPQMRPHLVSCLEDGNVVAFPKIRDTRRKRQAATTVVFL